MSAEQPKLKERMFVWVPPNGPNKGFFGVVSRVDTNKPDYIKVKAWEDQSGEHWVHARTVLQSVLPINLEVEVCDESFRANYAFPPRAKVVRSSPDFTKVKISGSEYWVRSQDLLVAPPPGPVRRFLKSMFD